MRVNEIRSAKRGKNERSGVHSWHPYYAGYSENFVNDILTYLDVDQDAIVLDPWVGSGTTTLVSQNRGLKSIGVEINPAMVIFSQAKTASLLNYNIRDLSKEILKVAKKVKVSKNDQFENKDVLEYINEDKLKLLNDIRYSVDLLCESLDTTMEISSSIKSFFYAALFRSLRTVGNFKKGRNPTWLVKEVPELLSEVEVVDVFVLFEQFVNSMVKDLEQIFSDVSFKDYKLVPQIIEGNSKANPLDKETVDVIITSPPYLTRIDYAVSTKPELLFLGLKNKDEFDFVRRATMGAPVIADKNIEVNKEWGKLVCSFLDAVKNHESKAAKSYYYPIFVQYFRDAFDSLKEIRRVLKSGGKACLVVQSSYFKDVEAKLGEMYIEMGESLGFEASIVMRDKITQHLAHVNIKSSKYVKNKIYHEDAVLLRKKEDNVSEYSTHKAQVEMVKGVEKRIEGVEQALVNAFERHVFIKEVKFINFGNMDALELARAFVEYPIIIKALLATVNVAGRAVKRDLSMSIDSYSDKKLSLEKASILAGYIKPMLPNELAIPAILELDRWFYVDKEIRKNKGSWEKHIIQALIENSDEKDFKKAKFTSDKEKYELDVAFPSSGEIKIGIDVKRIEAKQDIHKRADEIINKAVKFKKQFPSSKFYVLVYYPFPAEHLNLLQRLKSNDIDGVYFADESISSIEQQAKSILSSEGLLKEETIDEVVDEVIDEIIEDIIEE